MTTLILSQLRKFSDAELTAINECAKAGFSLEQTAVTLQSSIDDFLISYFHNAEVQNAYDAGYLQSKLELNQKINALALNGSAAAQSEMRKIQTEQEITNFMKTLDE